MGIVQHISQVGKTLLFVHTFSYFENSTNAQKMRYRLGYNNSECSMLEALHSVFILLQIEQVKYIGAPIRGSIVHLLTRREVC